MATDKTMVRTRKNKDNPYVMLDKTGLHDDRLSWKAKGLHAYLMSLPDDWTIYITELAKHAKDGRDSTRAAFKELEVAGYITNEAIRNEKGRIEKWEKIVYEQPLHWELIPKKTKQAKQDPDTENPYVDPDTENPDLENPHLEKPDLENPTLLINKNTNDLNEQNNDLIKNDDEDKKNQDIFISEFVHEAKERNIPNDEIQEVIDQLQGTSYQMQALDSTLEKVLPKYAAGEVSKFSSYFVSVLKREQRRLDYISSQPEQEPGSKIDFPFYNWLEENK